MIDGIAAAEILRGVRGAPPADRKAIAKIIVAVSALAADFPEIQELDLNPVFARPDGAIAADVRIIVDFAPPKARYRPTQEDRHACVVRLRDMPARSDRHTLTRRSSAPRSAHRSRERQSCMMPCSGTRACCRAPVSSPSWENLRRVALPD